MYGIGPGFFLRHWVVAASSPWITGENTFESKPSALDGAMFTDSFNAIIGTGWCIPA